MNLIKKPLVINNGRKSQLNLLDDLDTSSRYIRLIKSDGQQYWRSKLSELVTIDVGNNALIDIFRGDNLEDLTIFSNLIINNETSIYCNNSTITRVGVSDPLLSQYDLSLINLSGSLRLNIFDFKKLISTNTESLIKLVLGSTLYVENGELNLTGDSLPSYLKCTDSICYFKNIVFTQSIVSSSKPTITINGSSTVTFENCIINDITDINISGSSVVIFKGCKIYSVGNIGNAIYLYANAKLKFIDCDIKDLSINKTFIGSRLIIERCRFFTTLDKLLIRASYTDTDSTKSITIKDSIFYNPNSITLPFSIMKDSSNLDILFYGINYSYLVLNPFIIEKVSNLLINTDIDTDYSW